VVVPSIVSICFTSIVSIKPRSLARLGAIAHISE
jgi:hypothetical protein